MMRALPVPEWPEAERCAWEAACRPGVRLKRGGRASHLKPITRDDLERRYGYFLHHLAASEDLDLSVPAGEHRTCWCSTTVPSPATLRARKTSGSTRRTPRNPAGLMLHPLLPQPDPAGLETLAARCGTCLPSCR